MNTMKPNMKIYRQILLAVLVVCLGAVSCKKNKTDEEDLPYLTGTLSFRKLRAENSLPPA